MATTSGRTPISSISSTSVEAIVEEPTSANSPEEAQPQTVSTEGMPVLEIKVDKAAIARRGLSVSEVQDVIGAAVGGQDAGVVYEGDRSFDIVVRLPESVRSDLEALSNLPVALPKATPSSPVQSLPLNRDAQFSFNEGPKQISRENGKRRIVVTANVRGRDLGSVVEDAQAKVRQAVQLPPGYWMTWGGQSENLAAARQRLAVVALVARHAAEPRELERHALARRLVQALVDLAEGALADLPHEAEALAQRYGRVVVVWDHVVKHRRGVHPPERVCSEGEGHVSATDAATAVVMAMRTHPRGHAHTSGLPSVLWMLWT